MIVSVHAPSPFKKFVSGKVNGLAYVRESELNILAIWSDEPGHGHVRAFIKECQGGFTFIRFWVVENYMFRNALIRYGFTQGHDVDRFGEMQEVFDWSRNE